ncbi:arginine--tRNA ligase [Streptomonospora nanhaiensis]|uniref:Arginine--tRNA ligase n=1 Tax=Streptomonospora nanhaiensis TaxID=1323731 RepID=A0A853BT78_9ACTN|nr:arginine--tRNA ligase [Streptomonospora nanhaiensis]MBV2364957.1 arginine--tRNA ligase [Streptomonospora nanhaiensis]NYI97522.1 arginyl-tRNA synthetase [Streptomonospora nanhaiensis]
MADPQEILAQRVQSALGAAFGPDFADTDPVIRPSQFADFQANAALPLAKRLGRAPRDVAADIVAHLDVSDMCRDAEISGPGFINLTLRDDWIAARAQDLLSDPRAGIPQQEPQTIPIDYSAPNVAKEMHVGHLRTTVVGDALARVLEALGHNVVRQNHIGDWGTPFGMLIEHLLDSGEHSPEAELVKTDPNAFYQAARTKFDASPEFAERARKRVVALQAGDPETLRLWRELVDLSKIYFNRVYATLDVTLTDSDLAGESMYNDMLPGICDELEDKGIAEVSEGALCVFQPEFTGREGKPVPLIVRKSDGGYGYGTTDLATIRYRVEELGATSRVVYVVGAPQALHFRMVWAAARKAGWLPDRVTPIHVQIGNVLGDDGKILRTRSGQPIRLMALLEEAVDRAAKVVAENRPDLDDATRAAIAREVGIGAVKYADLSVSHDTEYVFDYDRMLALNGNTGPYLQYAAARIRSIFRKGGVDPDSATGPITLTEPAERDLALALLGFGPVVSAVGDTLEPHRLCGYLFDLAQAFTAFFEHCPVLQAEDPAVRDSRLALIAATLRTLVTGLGLLGVRTPEQM